MISQSLLALCLHTITEGAGQDLQMTAVQSTTHCLPVSGSSASGLCVDMKQLYPEKGRGWAAGIPGVPEDTRRC